jgi:hypothetical protein
MTNEPMDPRKKALVDAMGGTNTGIGGVPNTAQLSAPPSAPSTPIGGGDRGYEMPGTGSSGGVEDASRMLAESTARNNSLKDLGNRRSRLDLFDRAGHEGLDREESQIFGGAPRSSYTDALIAPPASPGGASQPASPFKADTSKWNTDGFATPGYTPAGSLPSLGSGWDEGKWNDPNHQTPKYVFGRILQEASGGTGRLKDPAQRERAVSNILKAYPGAKFDGKDKITMPDGGVIDIFGGAGSGDYTASFQLQDGTGKDASGRPLPRMGGGGNAPMAGSALSPMIAGNAQNNIQNALQGIGAQANDSRLQELIKALGGA